MKKSSEKSNLSKISKFIDSERGLRASAVNATEVVKHMQSIQNTLPVPTMLVGRSMVAATLLASQLKDGEVISLYFRGDGPIEMVFAEADFEGGVRGYTPQPQLNLPLKSGKLDLSSAIGQGFLNVVRSKTGSHAPYRGSVEIQTGEVGEDVAYYLQQSEQRRSLVSLGVKINSFGQVLSAGGVIIELLPDADPELATVLTEQLAKAGSLSETVEKGATNQEIVNMYLPGFRLEELEHPYFLNYSCRCTRARLKRSLALLPVSDLDQIIERKEKVDAKCEFCGRSFSLSYVEAKKIRDKKYRESLN